jgi:hypothetical protein
MLQAIWESIHSVVVMELFIKIAAGFAFVVALSKVDLRLFARDDRDYVGTLLNDGEGDDLVIRITLLQRCPNEKSWRKSCQDCDTKEPQHLRLAFCGPISTEDFGHVLHQLKCCDLYRLWQDLCVESKEEPYDQHQLAFMSQLLWAVVMTGYADLDVPPWLNLPSITELEEFEVQSTLPPVEQAPKTTTPP